MNKHEVTTNTKIENAKRMIKDSIKWAEEDLANERTEVLKIAENGSADEIISWARNMKDTETRIHSLKQQLKVVEFMEA